jgi:hypothetical protein
MQDERAVRANTRGVAWAAWSPAQIVAIATGLVFIALGVATLSRTGLDANGFARTHVTVFGFDHTPLLGACELGFGLLMLAAGAVPGAGRVVMAFLGALAVGAGLVVLIQPSSLHLRLGVHAGNGWLYLISGTVSLVAAMLAPVVFGRSAHATGREVAETTYHEDAVHSHR